MILEPTEINSMASESDYELEQEGNPAMADALQRVLNMGKNLGQSITLAKAKLSVDVTSKQKLKTEFAIEREPFLQNSNVEENKEEKPDLKTLKRKRIKKKESAAIGRTKPSYLDREKERMLMKMATQGVVQLFNAVKEQQKFISKKLESAGQSETKKEKVLKSIDKRAFLDVLMGQSTKSLIKEEQEVEIKTENEDSNDEVKEEQPSWSVLRDDFMMGAKLKDWNKTEAPTIGDADNYNQPSKKARKQV